MNYTNKTIKKMEQLRELNLSDEDFDLIVEGLDHLPNKSQSAELIVDLMAHTMLPEEGKDEWEAKKEKERLTKEHEKKLLFENIKILQGKLLMLRRVFRENDCLDQANKALS